MTIFHLKIIVFTAAKYCSILHRRVCVMKRLLPQNQKSEDRNIGMQLWDLELYKVYINGCLSVLTGKTVTKSLN